MRENKRPKDLDSNGRSTKGRDKRIHGLRLRESNASRKSTSRSKDSRLRKMRDLDKRLRRNVEGLKKNKSA